MLPKVYERLLTSWLDGIAEFLVFVLTFRMERGPTDRQENQENARLRLGIIKVQNQSSPHTSDIFNVLFFLRGLSVTV